MGIHRSKGFEREENRSKPVYPSIHLGMGANLFGDGCSFRVWAPDAIEVSVCIWHDEQICQVSLAPEPSNSCYWSVDVAGIVANQPYQFLIENKGGDAINPGNVVSRVDAYTRQVESAEDNARGIIIDFVTFETMNRL